MGARSKQRRRPPSASSCYTTVPRWGRDQNRDVLALPATWPIPRCPGGGEIKTGFCDFKLDAFLYHGAPVGARSKRKPGNGRRRVLYTTVPRWGRDQNLPDGATVAEIGIPRCPGGGEIKTARWTFSNGRLLYHGAPVGARSKHTKARREPTPTYTTVPRWGRDQNRNLETSQPQPSIPRCPGGGEIKTAPSTLT